MCTDTVNCSFITGKPLPRNQRKEEKKSVHAVQVSLRPLLKNEAAIML